MKRRFIARQVILFGGISGVLGVIAEYQRRFGWHMGFNFHFAVRALAVLFFWLAVWYLISLWWWAQAPKILAKQREKRPNQHEPKR